jgi:hypothetical protein
VEVAPAVAVTRGPLLQVDEPPPWGRDGHEPLSVVDEPPLAAPPFGAMGIVRYRGQETALQVAGYYKMPVADDFNLQLVNALLFQL